MTLENDRGESIDFCIEWVRDRETGESIGIYEISGGTGRFTDASGSGDFRAIPAEDALVTLDGTISY